jgi:hypothetical protein
MATVSVSEDESMLRHRPVSWSLPNQTQLTILTTPLLFPHYSNSQNTPLLSYVPSRGVFLSLQDPPHLISLGPNG